MHFLLISGSPCERDRGPFPREKNLKTAIFGRLYSPLWLWAGSDVNTQITGQRVLGLKRSVQRKDDAGARPISLKRGMEIAHYRSEVRVLYDGGGWLRNPGSDLLAFGDVGHATGNWPLATHPGQI